MILHCSEPYHLGWAIDEHPPHAWWAEAEGPVNWPVAERAHLLGWLGTNPGEAESLRLSAYPHVLVSCDGSARWAVTGRPKRRMPSLAKIAAFHDMGPTPHCYRCGTRAPENPWGSRWTGWRAASWFLDRAHMIDRWADGLDNCANLYPLCPACHGSQPVFKVGDEDAARAWLEVCRLPSRNRLSALR